MGWGSGVLAIEIYFWWYFLPLLYSLPCLALPLLLPLLAVKVSKKLLAMIIFELLILCWLLPCTWCPDVVLAVTRWEFLP
jgi:hypothetical protein